MEVPSVRSDGCWTITLVQPDPFEVDVISDWLVASVNLYDIRTTGGGYSLASPPDVVLVVRITEADVLVVTSGVAKATEVEL